MEESQLNALEVEEDDPTFGQDDGEPLAVAKDKVDSELNLGLVIPSVELGASLGAEYKGALGSDETLKEWKGWGTTRTNGFLWEDGILKRVVEDVITGSRELVVIPVGMRQRMLALVYDYLRGSNCPGTSGTLPEFQSKNLSRTETLISLLLSRKLCLAHE